MTRPRILSCLLIVFVQSGCNEKQPAAFEVSPAVEQVIKDINLLLREQPSGYAGSTFDGKSFTVSNHAEIQNPFLRTITTLHYADRSEGWYTRALPVKMIGKIRIESGAHNLCGEGYRITSYCIRDKVGKQIECGSFEDYVRAAPTKNSETRAKLTTRSMSVIGGEYLFCTGAQADRFVGLVQALLQELKNAAPEIEDRTSD